MDHLRFRHIIASRIVIAEIDHTTQQYNIHLDIRNPPSNFTKSRFTVRYLRLVLNLQDPVRVFRGTQVVLARIIVAYPPRWRTIFLSAVNLMRFWQMAVRIQTSDFAFLDAFAARSRTLRTDRGERSCFVKFPFRALRYCEFPDSTEH